MTNEIWKPLTEYKFYNGRVLDGSERIEVSNQGRVRYSDSKKLRKPIPKGTNAGQIENKYLCIWFKSKETGIQHWLRVHRAVASMFVPGYEPGLEIDHIDDDYLNNEASNLRWVTRQENMKDRCKS